LTLADKALIAVVVLKSPADIMIEFAKLHVEAAKKEYHKVLVKQGIVTNAGIGYFDNVYSINNIK